MLNFIMNYKNFKNNSIVNSFKGESLKQLFTQFIFKSYTL